MVSAYRLDHTGDDLRRAVYSWVYNWVIQLSFGTRLRAGVGRPSLVCTPSFSRILLDVIADRRLADPQFGRDVRRRHAVGEQVKDLHLTLGQRPDRPLAVPAHWWAYGAGR
jgi:hypothetical protein